MPTPYPTPLTPDELAKYPPHVAAVMQRVPPTTCYRLVRQSSSGHYWIHSFSEGLDADGKPTGAVKLILGHGADSFLPGMGVRGIDPSELVECGCGKWEPATEDQLYWMREHVACLDLARSGATRPPSVEGSEAHKLKCKLAALHAVASGLVSAVQDALMRGDMSGIEPAYLLLKEALEGMA